MWGDVNRHDDPMIDVAIRPPHNHGDESPQPSVHARAAYAIRNTQTACAARTARRRARLAAHADDLPLLRVPGAVDDVTVLTDVC